MLLNCQSFCHHCPYIYTDIHMYIHMYSDTHTCTHWYTNTCTHTHGYIHTWITNIKQLARKFRGHVFQGLHLNLSVKTYRIGWFSQDIYNYKSIGFWTFSLMLPFLLLCVMWLSFEWCHMLHFCYLSKSLTCWDYIMLKVWKFI